MLDAWAGEGRGSVFQFRFGMLRSPNLDKPEEVAARTLEEMASRTLEEGNCPGCM